MLFAFTSRCTEVDEREIIFVVTIPDSLVTNDTLYIVGSEPQLGNWQPNAVPLIQMDKNTYQLKVKLPLNVNI